MGTNKCLSEKIIQHFIDNELDKEGLISTMQHLKTCSLCAENVKAQRDWANLVKASARNNVSSSENPILLNEIMLNKNWNRPQRFNIHKLTKIAALLILFFGSYLLFREKEAETYQPTAQELLLWEQHTMGDDANQIWHDRMISAVETNAGGEVLQIDIY